MELIERAMLLNSLAKNAGVHMTWVACLVRRKLPNRLCYESLCVSVLQRMAVVRAFILRRFLQRQNQIHSDHTFRTGIQSLDRALPFVKYRHVDRCRLESRIANGSLHKPPYPPAAVSKYDRHIPACLQDAKGFRKCGAQQC